jgi:putative restriction endonuclease
MDTSSLDTLIRLSAFEHVRRLNEIHDHFAAAELKPGFAFRGERIPLVNPQRGIFKPQQMRYLLSIKTYFRSQVARFGMTIKERSTARYSKAMKL